MGCKSTVPAGRNPGAETRSARRGVVPPSALASPLWSQTRAPEPNPGVSSSARVRWSRRVYATWGLSALMSHSATRAAPEWRVRPRGAGPDALDVLERNVGVTWVSYLIEPQIQLQALQDSVDTQRIVASRFVKLCYLDLP